MFNFIAFAVSVPSSIAVVWVLSVLIDPKRGRGGVLS